MSLVSHLSNVRRRESAAIAAGLLALAAITSMLLTPSASAATPLSISGETLNGSGMINAPPCGSGFVNKSGSFAVSGMASGPYLGTFTENGTYAVSGQNRGPFSTLHAYFNATFVITSPGMLPITGTLSGQGGAFCRQLDSTSFGYVLWNDPVGYALTGSYSGGGAAGWPASGALVNATFNATTQQGSIREQFAGGSTVAPPPAGGFTPAATVTSGSSVNIGATASTVWGTVDDKGEVATYRFDYGTSTNYTSQTISEPVSDSNSTPTSVDARLTGLSPNTVYHYRVEATDAWGTSYGADQTFTTTG